MDKNTNNNVFSLDKLKKYVNKNVYKQYFFAVQNYTNLTMKTKQEVMLAILKWAKKMGATHYTHWFCALNNQIAEKYVVFLPNKNKIKLSDTAEFMQSQADASSFVTNSTTSTYQACGYVVWDQFSLPFIKTISNLKVLYIPSLFYNYHGQSLDYKEPLIRSCKYLSNSVTELLQLLGEKHVSYAHSIVGCEQEYFLLDKKLVKSRKDISLTGQTLFGTLQTGIACKNNYYSPINNGLYKFIEQLNYELKLLGIPAKVQHNEAGYKQLEIVTHHCKANISAEQNILLMQTIKSVAEQNNFVAIFNEKPFEKINGSGKHLNWSIASSSGTNLLDIYKTDRQIFLTIFSAILAAISKNYSLLMAAVTTVSNSFRLGGAEAPTTAFSVFVGKPILNALIKFVKIGKFYLPRNNIFKDSFQQDICNRNRTSTFAFTGNKFEFRAVGASQNVAFVSLVLNTIVAFEIDKISQELKQGKKISCIVKDNIKDSLKVVYNGNCYNNRWKTFAASRGIKDYNNRPEIYDCFLQKQISEMFCKSGILNGQETKNVVQALYKNYKCEVISLSQTFCEQLGSQVLPSLCTHLQNRLKLLNFSKCNKQKSEFLKEEIKTLQNSITKLYKHKNRLTNLVRYIENQKSYKNQSLLCYNFLLPQLTIAKRAYSNVEQLLPQNVIGFATYSDLLLTHY